MFDSLQFECWNGRYCGAFLPPGLKSVMLSLSLTCNAIGIVYFAFGLAIA
jgi:hypothetical protein